MADEAHCGSADQDYRARDQCGNLPGARKHARPRQADKKSQQASIGEVGRGETAGKSGLGVEICRNIYKLNCKQDSTARAQTLNRFVS